MRVTVVGCGYVGLVTGACLAEIGHTVVCTDTDKSKIDVLRSGGIPIFEPSLDVVVARNCQAGRLSFTPDTANAVRTPEVIFICVGTPPLKNGDADLSAISRVARTIATESQTAQLIVEKSTVPVQTGKQLKRALDIYSRDRGVRFHIASNPEFLREGTAVLDFMHPDRIVVGVEDELGERYLREIYRPIIDGTVASAVHAGSSLKRARPQFIVTSINGAELIKHAANSFLALKISYANLLADMCEQLDADVDQVTGAIGLDPRIGTEFFQPGLGFGGFCLPKDVQAFINMGRRCGVDTSLVNAAECINKARVRRFVEQIRAAMWVLNDKSIAVLGLSFKPNTDDVRFSPSIELVRSLVEEGARVRAYDPHAMEKAAIDLPLVELAEDEYDALQGADALVIATSWPQFASLNWDKVCRSMSRPLIFDGRNLLNPAQMADLGFEYHSVGRPSVQARSAAREEAAMSNNERAA